MYHELAHMEVDGHGPEFDELLIKVRRECTSKIYGRPLGSAEYLLLFLFYLFLFYYVYIKICIYVYIYIFIQS